MTAAGWRSSRREELGERQHRVAVLAADECRDPLADGGQRLRVLEDLAVAVGMGVDEARCEREAVPVDRRFARQRSERLGSVGDGDDPVAGDAQASRAAGSAAAVEDQGMGDQGAGGTLCRGACKGGSQGHAKAEKRRPSHRADEPINQMQGRACRPIGRETGHTSCCTLSAMRRPAVLAYTLFAMAASLPAEVRECLPIPAACAHRAATPGSSCARAVAVASPRASLACRRERPGSCSKTRPTRNSDNCRLHPTPPVALGSPTALPAPPAAVLVEIPVRAQTLDPSRADWREAPALRPRASPASTPRSPRPPPFTV